MRKLIPAALLLLAASALGGCVYQPAPGYGYYYAPAPAAVYVGGGWGGGWHGGWGGGWGGHWR